MNNNPNQQLMVWWVLWAAFMTGIFPIYFFLGSGNGSSQAAGAESTMWVAALLPLGASTIIRWGVLPRINTAQAALPLFIVGIAFAEATCFLGLFLFPAQKQGLFILSAIGIFQFIPLFASRFFKRE